MVPLKDVPAHEGDTVNLDVKVSGSPLPQVRKNRLWKSVEPCIEIDLCIPRVILRLEKTNGKGKLGEDTFQCIQRCPSPFQ